MSVNKNEALLNGETHSIKVKKEVVDYYEAQQEEEEVENDMASVTEEMPWNAYTRTETQKKRLRDSEVTQNSRRSSDQISYEFQGWCTCVMERAKMVEANLDPECPSFIKLIIRCYLTGHKISLPPKFCKQHMLNNGDSMVLVGQNGVEHTVKYIKDPLKSNNPIFSSGWTGFVHEHKLQEGDGLIFQLVSPCKFKVHIVRRNEILSADAKECNCVTQKMKAKKVDPKGLSKKAESVLESHSNSNTLSMDGTFVDFQRFTINVNGFNIDSELSENIRTKYYELCLTRKLYLHERLHKTIKPKLAAELISGMIDIVDAIRGTTLNTFQDNFVVWDKTLEGFESLGMDVGFLRSCLNQLNQKQTVFESEIAKEVQRCESLFQEAARSAC